MSSASIDQLGVVVVEVDGAVRADTWAITAEKDTLGYLQDAVGGLIDVVGLTESVDMWVNDEGLFLCEPNPLATMLAAGLADRDLAQPFFGPAVFTGSCDEAGTTLGLTVAQLAEVLRQAEWLREYTADTLAEIAAIGQGIAARIR